MPVSKISTFGDRSRNAGGSRWIGQRSSPDGAGFSSIGSPITFHRRPSVPSPTGTEMGPPVSTTSIPRGRPSVESIATARTRSSPRCCCTSATSSPPSGRVIRSAEYTSGSRSGKTASTTTPLISTTLPTFLLLPFASIALLAWRNPRAGRGRRSLAEGALGEGRDRGDEEDLRLRPDVGEGEARLVARVAEAERRRRRAPAGDDEGGRERGGGGRPGEHEPAADGERDPLARALAPARAVRPPPTGHACLDEGASGWLAARAPKGRASSSPLIGQRSSG